MLIYKDYFYILVIYLTFMDKNMVVGGQAVIEGVMMKSPNYYSVSVRKPDKSIITKVEMCETITNKYKFLRLPFLRGVVVLFQMLIIGTKSLIYSANEAIEDEEENKVKEKKIKTNSNNSKYSKKSKNSDNSKSSNMSNFTVFTTISFSLLFAIGLFVVLPYYLTTFTGLVESESAIIFNLVDGVIKLFIFILYILAIGMMPDIKRVFQYHGAEHKAINCWEDKKELNVKNVQKYSTLNPRCGTSFLIFVIMIGILILSFIPVLLVWIYPAFFSLPLWLNKLILILTRIIFLLPVAGVSYEFLKFTAKYKDNPIMKIFMLPGYGTQLLTTRQPEDDQVEVSINALKAVLNKEK